MVKIDKLVYSFLLTSLITGCTIINPEFKKDKKSVIEEFNEDMKTQNKKKLLKPPPLILPPVYQKPTILNTNKKVTFSAVDAPLSKLLYTISKEVGLNLALSDDLDLNKSITLNMKNAPIDEVLDIAMDVTGAYFEIKGNILFVKKLMTKTFQLPFIRTTTDSSSELGGDLLGGNGATSGGGSGGGGGGSGGGGGGSGGGGGGSGGGLSGTFSVNYNNPEELNDFYTQIDENMQSLISEDGKYSLNKFSGTLIVTDNRRHIKKIEEFLNSIKEFLSKQVLIEAKIMEVVLNNANQLGVNWENTWENINRTIVGVQSLNGLTSPVNDSLSSIGLASPISNSATAMTLAYNRDNFSAIIQAMESSGNVEIISNPRIKVLNGQTGIISSGNIVPFWEKEVTYTQVYDQNNANNTNLVPEVTYTRRDVMHGISLGVTPQIKEDGTILLNVVPVITNIEGEKTFSDGNADVAKAPIINVKEAGTMILAKDNDMVVIGGLINTIKKDENYEVPILGSIPLFGNAFKRVEHSSEKRELVIVLRIKVEH